MESHGKVLGTVHHTRQALFEEDWETNEVEWNGKAETKADFPAAGEAGKAVFWPTLGWSKRTFESPGFSAEESLISASAVPHGWAHHMSQPWDVVIDLSGSKAS